MIRSTLERASRRVVLKRRLPEHYGGCRMYVTPDAGLRYWRSNFENIDRFLLQRAVELTRRGAVIWDVGANVGLFSFAAAGLAGPQGKVFAIEPDVEMVKLLRRSAHSNNGSTAPVEVLPVAVSDHVGIERFLIAVRSRSANFLEGHGTTQTGGVRERQSVMSVTLDWLAERLPAPDVLKIDAEAAEARILSAAHELLSKHRPVILAEVSADSVPRVTEILKEHNYQILDAATEPIKRKPLDEAPWDTLAVPR